MADHEIRSASPTGMASPTSITFAENTTPPKSGTPTKPDELDLSDSHPVPNNRFAFTPAQLNKLATTRTIAALDAFGGLHGLAAGLRTDLAAGLGVDEASFDDTVAFEEAVAAGKEHRKPKTTPLPSDGKKGHELAPAFKLEFGAEQKGFTDRRRIFGENRVPRRKQKSFLQLAWIAFNDKLMFLLTVSATISLALGIYETVSSSDGEPKIQWVDGVTVVVAIVVIVFATATTDWRKNAKFAKLTARKEQRDVKVIRSGKTQNISIYDLLVGDVMHIETGDVVAVDGVLIRGSGIQVDESSLSGESDLVHKSAVAQGKGEEVSGIASLKQSAVHRVSASDPFILSGTTVNGGVGSYLIISVGVNSTFGRTLHLVQNDVEPTPLQQKLGKLAKQLITFGVIAGFIFFLIMFIRFVVNVTKQNPLKTPSENAMTFFKTLILAVTVIVVTVPEGLALAVTLALAFATSRMLQDNNLVRMIRSCEVMGNATCICSDKTGTLTQNKMTVVAGHIGMSDSFGDAVVGTSPGSLGNVPNSQASASGEEVDETEKKAMGKSTETPAAAVASPPASRDTGPMGLMQSLTTEAGALIKDGIALNSTAFEDGDGKYVGMSTETALLDFARTYLGMGPVNEERENANIVDLLPFDASNKWMAVMVRLPNDRGFRMFVKGAAEVVLGHCKAILTDPTGGKEQGGSGLTAEELPEETRAELRETVCSYAVQMLRPVAMAYRDFKDPSEIFRDPKDPTSVRFRELFRTSGLTWTCIFGIKDPLRPEVIDSVRQCQEAGVLVRMVTGDNFLTAKAIASECGIYTAGGVAMDGPTFRRLTPMQMGIIIPRLQVLARSSPEDKLTLVSHLKKMHETVAVTGDGTNDALALKAADVGFAMGVQGTEVAKEAASIILLDDNFKSIVKALLWGRTVNDAVRKFLQFQFTINITAGTLTVVSELAGDNIFKVVQLLWMNLIMDIFASVGLATDWPSDDFLKRKPQPRRAPLVSITMWKMILGQALYQLIVIFTLHYVESDIFTQTMVFNTYIMFQLFNQHNCRRVDNKLNIWYQGVLRNPFFLGVQLATIAGQMVIIWKGGEAFDTVPLNGPQWGWSLLFGVMPIPLGAALRCVPDHYVESAFRVLGRVLRFFKPAAMLLVPSRFSKVKRKHNLERRQSRISAATAGDDDEELGRLEDWILHAGAVLRRPIDYGIPGYAEPGGAHAGISLESRIQIMPAAQRQALAAAAQVHAMASDGGSVNLSALIEASRTAAEGGRSEGQLSREAEHQGFEVHPDTNREDPIMPSQVVDQDKWKKVPPSQDPDVVRYLASQNIRTDEAKKEGHGHVRPIVFGPSARG
ncbi:hypothetical protein RB594_001014 [Gaeumannomyces avenae]